MPATNENPTLAEKMGREMELNFWRSSWDDTWLEVAYILGKRRSRCSLAQVGAVIVTADQEVDSTCYNGPAAGLKVSGECRFWCPRAMTNGDRSPDYSACESIHAEENALIRADHSKMRGGTIYVSRSVCINCARRIANSGLRRVVHAVHDDDAHRDPRAVEKFLRDTGLEVVVAKYHRGDAAPTVK